MDLEEQIKNNKERNKKFLKEFKEYLKEKKYSEKTIKKHLSNAEFYINEYLNYYDITKAEDGIEDVGFFLSDFFIEKCIATKSSILDMASSLNKFYLFMSEKGYVKKEDYQALKDSMKEEKEYALERLEDYDNGTFFDI